jgi:hypothetical protein
MNRIWPVVVAILAAGFASSASADFADKLSKLVGYVIVDSKTKEPSRAANMAE